MGKGGVLATCCDILIAILLPPLGVFLKYGCMARRLPPKVPYLGEEPFVEGSSSIEAETLLRMEFWICLLLTILGYIPGIIYALCVLA